MKERSSIYKGLLQCLSKQRFEQTGQRERTRNQKKIVAEMATSGQANQVVDMGEIQVDRTKMHKIGGQLGKMGGQLGKMSREIHPQMVGNLEMVVYGVEKMIREGWQPNNNLQLRGR